MAVTMTNTKETFEKLVSKTDPIVKYIFPGGLEYSIINRPNKTVVVVPTQSGCRMGCKFCFLTARAKVDNTVRNLTSNEIIDGIMTVLDDRHFFPEYEIPGTANEDGEPLVSLPCKTDLLISFMSAGEPLNNLDSVLDTIEDLQFRGALTDQVVQFRFGVASIIPTIKQGMEFICGVDELRKEGITSSIKLHYSLHATTDEKRGQLIPNATTISSGLSILDIYRKTTGNPVEIHYTPIAGVNDTDEDILRLADLVNPGEPFHVKLLTFRAGADAEMRPSSDDRVQRIKEALLSSEIYNSPGSDILASCGQFTSRSK